MMKSCPKYRIEIILKKILQIGIKPGGNFQKNQLVLPKQKKKSVNYLKTETKTSL